MPGAWRATETIVAHVAHVSGKSNAEHVDMQEYPEHGDWRAAGAITAQVSGKRNAEVREPQEYPEYGEPPEQSQRR